MLQTRLPATAPLQNTIRREATLTSAGGGPEAMPGRRESIAPESRRALRRIAVQGRSPVRPPRPAILGSSYATSPSPLHRASASLQAIPADRGSKSRASSYKKHSTGFCRMAWSSRTGRSRALLRCAWFSPKTCAQRAASRNLSHRSRTNGAGEAQNSVAPTRSASMSGLSLSMRSSRLGHGRPDRPIVSRPGRFKAASRDAAPAKARFRRLRTPALQAIARERDPREKRADSGLRQRPPRGGSIEGLR